jgi:hypothetical protein
MKTAFIVMCLSFSVLSFAKSNPLDGFSKALAENIESVVENNPEKYEENQKSGKGSRAPASVKPDPLEKSYNINGFDKLEVGSSKL